MNDADLVYESRDYKRTRGAVILAAAFEYFVAILVSGTFLTKVLTTVGLSDAMIGIISSFISIAFLFQLLSIPLVQHVTNTKRVVIPFRMASHFFFLSLYVLPFLPIDAAFRRVLAVACILLAYFFQYLVNLLYSRWKDTFIAPTHRAVFGAGLEMVSLLGGMVVSLGVGFVLDTYEANQDLNGGFLFTAIAGLVFALCDFLCVMAMKNRIMPREKKQSIPFREVMKNTVGNREFRNITMVSILWNVAVYASAGFISVYCLKELMFSVTEVQVISIIGSVARMVVSKPFGRYSDRKSFIKGMELAFIIAAVAFGSMIFVTPQTRYLVAAYLILNAVCYAGINSNMHNAVYSYVDQKYFVQAAAIKNSASGICGFLVSILTGLLLTHIQENGNMLFGVHVYAQQVLCLISFALLVVLILFTHLVVGKQKVMVQ